MQKILLAYSQGELTWREAAKQLDVTSFDAFYALLQQEGFGLYNPTKEHSRAKIAVLDKWLDEEGV